MHSRGRHTIGENRSHVAPILPTDIEQRIRDLTEARDLHGLHQFLEHVSTLSCDLLQLLKRSLILDLLSTEP